MLTVNTTRPACRAGRISRVETMTLGTDWRNFSFVRIYTDEGIVGVGEITHPYRGRQVCSLVEEMARRHLVGADPFDIEEIWLRMYQGDFMRGGDMAGNAVSGVDQALYDIKGRALGVPVYQLLGGACRDRIPTYANGWYTGGRSPEAFAQKAKETVARGYHALKFDPFGTGLWELGRTERNLSLGIVEAVRDAVGPDVEIFIEGHARLTVHEAVRVGIELQKYDVGWFEEPMPITHVAEYLQVRDKTSVPIAGGEHCTDRFAMRPYFDHDAVHIIQPDVCIAGGFTELRKIAAIAEMHGMMVAPHNSNSPFCTTASVHVDLGMTNFKIQETFDDLMEPYVFDALKGVLPVKGGYIDIPTEPGLGITLVDEVFAEHPPRETFWNMWQDGWEDRKARPTV